jgi:hypothetical protein
MCTFQNRKVYVADAPAHIQRLVSVVKMVTVTAEDESSIVLLLWTKGLNGKDINKEMLPVYNGKCLSREAVHNWVDKREKNFCDDDEVETEVRKWL